MLSEATIATTLQISGAFSWANFSVIPHDKRELKLFINYRKQLEGNGYIENIFLCSRQVLGTMEVRDTGSLDHSNYRYYSTPAWNKQCCPAK